jgi:S-adenosyl-L-methionine hydrolase (adenosine-forming)
MAIISLITDFGIQDEYVGLMKAVILGIDPAAVLVDISHAIEPQDATQAAFMLECTFRYFPPGSIHVVVVDPGVGTDRAILYLESGGQFFLAPDNGVLSLVLDPDSSPHCRRVEASRVAGAAVSPTFHGRDLIAPAAGHLSRGLAPERLGPEISARQVVRLGDLKAEPAADGSLLGRVVHIDRFGNLITNIDASAWKRAAARTARRQGVEINGHQITCIGRTYADAAVGQALALVGSRGYLEIAVNGGSAQSLTNACKGHCVRVGDPIQGRGMSAVRQRS